MSSLHTLLTAGTFVLVSSCGCQPAKPPDADPRVAKNALVQVLNAWREGQSWESQAKLAPPIFVADEDWSNGRDLLSFTVSDTQSASGPSAVFDVELRFSRKSGERAVQARYSVTSAPALTIARQD